MFNFICLSSDSIILKIARILIVWLTAAPVSKKAKLEELTLKIKRSLEFLSAKDVVLNAP